MESSSKTTAGTDLWWIADAWNEDSLDWFLSMEERIPGYGTDTLRQIFDQYQPALPAAAPDATWLADFYLALGDPQFSEKDKRYDEPIGITNFVYDPANTRLSLPMQLVDYYLHFSGGQGRFEMLHQPQITERLNQLLTVIPFTAQEWEWLINKLEPESLGLFGGLFRHVVNNPVLPQLGPSEALSGCTPIDFIELQMLGGLQWLLQETMKVANGELHAPSRSTVFDPLDLLVKGVNARPHMLDKTVEVLKTAVGVSLEEHHHSTAKAGRPASTRTTEYVFCTNAAHTLLEIDAHPNYDGSTLEFVNQIFDELTVGETQPELGMKPLHVLSGDITDSSHPYYAEEVAIAHAAGLVPYQEDEEYFSNNELVYLLYALVNFSKEEARQSFQNVFLAPQVTERQLAGAGYLMPMLSVFFSELREAYDDKERNIPLAWLLEAGFNTQEGAADG